MRRSGVNRNRKVQSLQEANCAEVRGGPAAVIQVVGRRPAGWIATAVKAGRKVGQLCRLKSRPLEGW